MKEGEVEAQDGWISIYGGAKGGSRADPPFRTKHLSSPTTTIIIITDYYYLILLFCM